MNDAKLEWIARAQLVNQRMLLSLMRNLGVPSYGDFKVEVLNSRENFKQVFDAPHLGIPQDLEF